MNREKPVDNHHDKIAGNFVAILSAFFVASRLVTLATKPESISCPFSPA